MVDCARATSLNTLNGIAGKMTRARSSRGFFAYAFALQTLLTVIAAGRCAHQLVKQLTN
jgi:hypothetical protein